MQLKRAEEKQFLASLGEVCGLEKAIHTATRHSDHGVTWFLQGHEWVYNILAVIAFQPCAVEWYQHTGLIDIRSYRRKTGGRQVREQLTRQFPSFTCGHALPPEEFYF
jgi:hypothetical protein